MPHCFELVKCNIRSNLNAELIFTHFFFFSDQKKIYIGDDNPLTLIVNAQNQGEGAYEAELFVIVPPQADFIGVVRNNEVKLLLFASATRDLSNVAYQS